jgi:hypothetical protein
MEPLVAATAPELVAQVGVGTDTAGAASNATSPASSTTGSHKNHWLDTT